MNEIEKQILLNQEAIMNGLLSVVPVEVEREVLWIRSKETQKLLNPPKEQTLPERTHKFLSKSEDKKPALIRSQKSEQDKKMDLIRVMIKESRKLGDSDSDTETRLRKLGATWEAIRMVSDELNDAFCEDSEVKKD